MPRIDPVQLLNCLSVLLSPNGGIKSTDEVQRLVNLMTKFSKKLVSKCIYVQILKCTETELLGLFMGSGGWRLIHTWLTESIVAKNWPLVKELLELLLLCPVDIERLKTNNCPKLVKELSKDGNHFAIRALASKLVEQWLKTVKSEIVIPIKLSEIPLLIAEAQLETNDGLIKSEVPNEKLDKETKPVINDDSKQVTPEASLKNVSEECDSKIKDELDKGPETVPVLKISVKDGKQTISQVDETEKSANDKDRSKESRKNKEKSDKNKSSSSSKHSSKTHSSSSEKKSSSKSSSHSSSSSRHSSKDRSKDKDKHSSHSSKSKHSDSSSKPSSDKTNSSNKSKGEKPKSDKDKPRDKTKDEKNDKNKDSLKSNSHKNEEKAPSIHKLGKIPKLSDIKKDKPSISIEVRKPDEPKPKTVKTFHSKFRKHGLEEEVKPPPSRATLLNKKAPPPLPPTIPAPKRPSPALNDTPPEKKSKTQEVVEKPGAIKLIPPKPKPMMLLESDMFMDALNASATNKKEPKKRKRRTSGSKDGGPASESSPPQTPTVTGPAEKSVPPRFYQDTLDTDNKEKSSKSPADKADETEKEPEESMDTTEPHTLTINGLKGVLCYHKRKGPKKSIKWKPDTELEEIQYFELDETERVNVTKTFTDMKHLERINEREAFQKARNISTVDLMEERTIWRPLILVEADGQIEVEYGKNSKEKEIQTIRQKGTLQPLYFHKSMIPDSPLEAEPETHPYTEATIIPLDDVTGNTDNVSDFRNMPWPEPKGNAPPSSSSNSNMPIFPPNMTQFPGGFPPAQFHSMPGFPAPGMMPPDWPANMAMMANGMPGLPPAAIAGTMPPGMMVPPENMMMTPDMFGAPNPMFVGPDGFNMQPNMFPMDFNMAGPQGPQPVQGPGIAGPPNFHGANHGRGGGPGSGNWRGKGSGGWDSNQRGRHGPSRGGRKVCMYFQRKGSCRQGDKCSFLHPGVNCPY